MSAAPCWRPLLAAAAFLSACGGEATVGPETPVAARQFELTPGQATLHFGPATTSVQVSLVERDADGRTVPYTGPVFYWTRDTLVARVAHDGTVTPLEPGEATILATFGSGSQARTLSMVVTILSGLEPLDLTGYWDLTMVNQNPEPRDCWCGPYLGMRWEASLLLQGRGPSGLVGTHSHPLAFRPDGTRDSGFQGASGGGIVRSELSAVGRESIQMGDFTLVVRTVSPDLVTGRFERPLSGFPGYYGWTGHFELRKR